MPPRCERQAQRGGCLTINQAHRGCLSARLVFGPQRCCQLDGNRVDSELRTLRSGRAPDNTSKTVLQQNRCDTTNMQCLHSRACPTGAASTHVRPQSAVRRHLARAAFADRFSGEWEGALATFDASGKAEQLPEAVVPPQFKEWDVQVGMPRSWVACRDPVGHTRRSVLSL